MKTNKSKKSFVATMPHIANIDPFSSDSQVRVSSWQSLFLHGVGEGLGVGVGEGLGEGVGEGVGVGVSGLQDMTVPRREVWVTYAIECIGQPIQLDIAHERIMMVMIVML